MDAEHAASLTPGVDAGAVRKVVTVLFADLVGSTAFGEQVDPEAARDAMARYFRMIQDVIDAHAGTVAKFVGDGVMAVFGIPEVSEDDAHRAVAAGLALQRDFDAIRTHIHDRYDVEVGLRVGINTGEVVIADDDADIVGDALNTAARLEAACTPGRVMVGEDTWRLTRSHVTYEVLGEVTVKGKAEPVATFQVVEQGGLVDEAATPFVGRDAELDQLRRVLAEATEERVAKLVTVVGAPGVGKTRLALELARAQGDTVSWFDLRCERSGTATFAPIAELLRKAADISSDATAEEANAAIEAFVGDELGDRDRVIDLFASFVGTAAPRSTEEMFFACRRLLELVAGRQRALVVVDDIQWAEPLFLDLLEHLADWVSNAPLLIVALARPEIREIRPALSEVSRRVAAVLAVEGLDASATERLAAQLLGADALPAELTARLPESTEGNPLFVRELVRMMVDDGVVTRTDTGWEMAVDLDAVQVPPTIQSLLSTRVERMPAEERRFVELAAVVGSEFPLGAVAALIHDSERGQVQASIDRLRRKEVIEPTGAYWGDEPVFRFHHVLIRDAAYRRLLKRARADLHRQVGEWTEQTAFTLVGEHEPTIAFHYEQCHGYRTELGLLDDETVEVGDRAAMLLHAAAERALERDDLPAAGGLARRALATISADAVSRADLLLLACEALLGSGDVVAGKETLDQLDETADDARLQGWSACFHAQLIILTSPQELSLAEASVNAAAEQLTELGDDAGVAKARQVRAGALARLGRVGDCEAELDLALTAARSADDRRRVTAVLGSAPVAALWGPSPVARAGGRCLDVIRLLRITTGSPAVEATSVRCQAVLEALRGRFDAARSMLETSRSTAEELGLRHGLMETELYAGIVELLAGEPAAAEPHLREAYGGLGKLGIGADAGQAAAYLARSLLLQGHLDEAEELAAASDALAGQNPQTLIAARSAEAEILSARGEHAAAVELAEEAVGLATGRDIVVDHARACVVLARVRRAAGDHAGADQARGEAQRLFDLKGATAELLAETAQPAVPAVAHGELSDALAYLHTATAASSDLDNTASDVAREMLVAVLDGDRDGIDALLAEGHVLDDHRPISDAGPIEGRSNSVDALVDLGDMMSGAELRVVATRGDHLCLASIEWDYVNWGPQRGLHVIEIDDAHKQVHTINFRSADLADAVAELDRLYLGSLDEARGAVFRVLAEMSHRANAGDLDAMPEELASDLRAAGGDAVSVITAVDALTADGIVLQHEVVIERKHVVSSSIQVAMVESGLTTENESFGPGELDAALARFEELTSSPQAVPLNAELASPRPPVRNLAVEWMLEVQHVIRGRHWDELSGLLDEDIVISDRRRGPAGGREMRGREPYMLGVRSLFDVFDAVDVRPLATRGDHLALAEVTTTTRSGDVDDRVSVFRCAETGRLDLFVSFDPDDLASAVAALDRLYFEWLGAEYVHTERVFTALREAAGRRDVEGWAALLADDFVGLDHRAVTHFPEIGRHTWLDSVRQQRELAGNGVAYATEFHELRPDGGVWRSVVRAGSAGDAGFEWHTTNLVMIRNDEIVRFELFDAEDVDAALARFEELTPSSDARRVVENAATEFLVALRDAFNTHDWERFGNLCADAFDYHPHHSGPRYGPLAARADFVSNQRARADLGYRMDFEVVAIRGDRLALTAHEWRTDNDFVESLHAVLGVDDSGRLHHIATADIDDLDTAVTELDRLYFGGEGAPHSRLSEKLERVRAAAGRRTPEAWSEVVAADFVAIDHRSGFGDLAFNRASWLESAVQAAELAGEGVAFARIYHRLDQSGAVFDSELWTRSDDGATHRWPTTSLAIFDGDRLARLEMWDKGDVEAAVARFDELIAAEIVPAGRGAVDAPQLENQATRVAAEFNAAAFERGDFDAVRALMHPDATALDTRAVVGLNEVMPVETFIETLETYWTEDHGAALTTNEVVAVRGEGLVVERARLTLVDASEIAVVVLTEIDESGLITGLRFFDDTGAAMTELDRLYLDSADQHGSHRGR